jgi:hypothetical protein
MIKKSCRLSCFVAILIVCIMIGSTILPVALADEVDRIKGFDKGPSYKSVVPMKRVTFVNFDENSFLDDYAYLAAIPTAVFNDGGKLFSNPLLFYQDEYPVKEENELSLNARQGIDYFMEDWMSYSNGQLDQMTLINVPKDKVSQWKAKEYTLIEGRDPYTIASEIALRDWSYSDNAVVAVVDENFEKPNYVLNSKVEGRISGDKKIIGETFFSPQLNKLNPCYHYFEVPEGYKYLKSRTWWASILVGSGKQSALPLDFNAVIPPGDPDSQLYCKYNGEWMQAAITDSWNIGSMDIERAETYVYNSGEWRLGITQVPTKKIGDRIQEIYGSFRDIIRNMVRGITFQTDITIYPGIELAIPDKPPFGCRDANFKLTWGATDAHLGFSIIGPGGEEVLSATDEETNYQEIHLGQLGECLPDEEYSVCVYRLDEDDRPVDFKVEYSWGQNFTREEADSLTSATEGAVLASVLNAPLLYISASDLSKQATDVLYKLGVENVYLVDIGSHASEKVVKTFNEIAQIKENYKEAEQIYKAIMSLTGKNDVIFSTIDPWTKSPTSTKPPYNETKAGLSIGPAAYCAAHHGSPVLIVDNHPELSSAVVWHTEFWKRHPKGRQAITVAQMYLTGKRVYKFLKEHDFDREGEETMITVADQFEIGASWDRAFVGKAKPGRIFGSPVDTAYWISRNVFYPALIFENPAMNADGIQLIQGSDSERRKLFPWGQFGLKIKPSQEEKFTYPVLQLYVCYEYRLNEAFEKYYHFQYKSADDIMPGVSESMEPIDEGMVPGEKGAIWPDLSSSEVIPAYLEKGGYDNVFSTSFSANVNNLNKGVLLWITATHGDSTGSGLLLTWDPEKSSYSYLPRVISKRMGYMKEENPWRAYDWYLGSTENPDTLTMEIHGLLPGLLGNPNKDGLLALGQDYMPSVKPVLHFLTNLPGIRLLLRNRPWLLSEDYYKDGLVIASKFGVDATDGGSTCTGINLDKNLSNIHCCGWINTACLPAYQYMHLAMVRHGSPFQVIDPWPTSWYGTFWQQSIPRDIILGDTIGEAYMKGIQHVGIQYVTEPPQWWWDNSENVCFFGDPDLRVYVPSTEYSDANHWEKEDTMPLRYDAELSVAGHMPFGVTSYSHEKTPPPVWQQYIWQIALILIVILVIIAIALGRRKR